MPEVIDPVFTKTSPKRSFSLNRKRAFWLVFAKTGSIISGTGWRWRRYSTYSTYPGVTLNDKRLHTWNNLCRRTHSWRSSFWGMDCWWRKCLYWEQLLLNQLPASRNIDTRVQWFWHFFTFWGITTHPWHPKGPRIWKLAKKNFQLHPWPAEIFGKNRKMRFFGLVSKFNFRSPVWQIFTIFSACFIYGVLNTRTKF